MTNFQELLNPEVLENPEKVREIQSPPGFLDEKLIKVQDKASNHASIDVNELKIKKAWEVAFAPAKSIPMNLIMSYMTGNSLQVIPIMMTVMLLWSPLTEIFTATNKSFEKLQTKDNYKIIILTKLCFIMCQILNILVAVWKLYKMGLIPHTEADWIAWKSPIHFTEKLNII